jgi:hypothetical protein
MTVSQLQHYMVIYYLLFWVSRIRGVVRRVKQPRLRGDGWFFDVPVEAGFYEGPGRRILRGYCLRMAIPCILDIPAIGLMVTAHPLWLMWVILALVPAIHVNHLYNVSIAERQAWPFAKVEAAQTAVALAVGLSLTPRRMRDYTSWALEWAMGLATVGAALVLVHLYRTKPEEHNLRLVFWVPALLLYLQLGILLVKRIIVAWRTPLPTVQTVEHSEAKEATRRYYLLMCDWNRIVSTCGIVFWPILLSAPRAKFESLMKIWLGVWLVLTIAGAVWVEIRRKQLADMGVKVRPVRMPDLMGQADRTRWPVCFEPQVPMLVLKGDRGYSLNLANTVTYWGTAYLIGMACLLMLAKAVY